MDRKSIRRRKLLRSGLALGVSGLGVGVFGLAGSTAEGTPSTLTDYDDFSTDNSSTPTDCTALPTDKSTKPTHGQANIRYPGHQLDDAEDLTGWNVSAGTVSADSSRSYVGTQCAKMEGTGGGNAVVQIDVTCFDLTNAAFSYALYMDESHKEGKSFITTLLAPDWSNRIKFVFPNFSIGATGGWFQLAPGETSVIGSPTLGAGSTKLLNIRMNNISSGTRTLWLDDIRAVPKPSKGYLSIVWDDSNGDYYDEGWVDEQRYGFPTTMATITGRVGHGNSLTLPQMRDIQASGGEFCSHTHTHPDISSLDEEDVRTQYETSKTWLIEHGFTRGAGQIIHPGNGYTGEDRKIATEYFEDVGVLPGAAKSMAMQLNGFDPTQLPRHIAVDYTDTKRFVDDLAANNEAGIINLHTLGDVYTMPRSDYQTLLSDIYSHVRSGDLEVVTLSELIDLRKRTTPSVN